ncbi:cysteine-rich receptor-like protein kinase 44 isoform X1 [Lolium perenne]|uniref:cysteine-rich receptor-like protein kinase 44 isoform X1 n=1 Tax=Lolium perenne TaxID=4522 RepID=UPI0021F61C8A|nr:cysteine-rich receptor-like protein kinase 44 isoform X1 [Lolium perenne]
MGSKASKYENLESMLHDQSSEPHKLPFKYLKKITNSFSDERVLGRGGSGVVYKGELRNGKAIAVKKLERSLPGFEKQFTNEVYHFMKLKHPNIVRLLGYCYETHNVCVKHNGKYVFAEMSERLLCLEYYPNGSLDQYLSDESSGLDWPTRYKIIEGICYGLYYLHAETDTPVLHLDLKPANILLDDDMLPKLTDFGLSKLLDQQQTICTSSRDGTLGYMAPEYLHGGIVTTKSDIFSLGVIIMEVIRGDRDYPGLTETSSEEFTELTLNKWRNALGKAPGSTSLEVDCQQIKRCIQIGLLCVNPERARRPTTTKVMKMLQGMSEIYQISTTDMGEACSQMDLTAIHQILVLKHYKDDERAGNELSFQEWTQGIQDTLNIKKRGDIAFRDEDFEAAIDNYTQLIGVMVIPSVTVFARRSFCYLMSDSDQSAAALRDAMQAQATFPDCPTGLYMQSVALTRLNLHSDATEMLNQASQLEVKWIQKSEDQEMERQKKSNDASHSDGGETFSFPTILLNS